MLRGRFGLALKALVACYILTSVFIIFKMHSRASGPAIEKWKEKGMVPFTMETTVASFETSMNITRTGKMTRTGLETTANIVTDVPEWRPSESIRYQFNKYNGPGANGTGILIPGYLNKTKISNFMSKKHGFNLLISDLIGAHRSFGDCRPQKCREKRYPRDLPPASVIIIFRDEYPSIVLRTAYSVLDTTPDHLLKDVVLVDDGSVDEDVKTAIDIHVANVEKFHLIRNKEPLGLMMARQKGIEAAKADYFIVMDSHMEVCEGWMEPIIYRLVQEPKALLSPQVGGINKETFKIEIGEGFDRAFMYLSQISMAQVWVSYDEKYVKMRNKSVEPLTFPVMQGMIMAMKKDFFLQLGGFDPGMKVWGTEQMEMSVKVWLCGGRVEILPCSRVGHMFRVTPWGRTIDNVNHIAGNRARFAAVWLEGEHKDFVLELQTRKGSLSTDGLENRTVIKQNNHCKPYGYFLEQVKQLANIYIPNNTLAVGQIFSDVVRRCWDNIVDPKTKSGQLGVYGCHHADNQYFVWTEDFQIRFEQHIIFVKQNSTELFSRKSVVKSDDPGTIFHYRDDNSVFHKQSELCVTLGEKFLSLKKCDGEKHQIWEWKRLRKPAGPI